MSNSQLSKARNELLLDFPDDVPGNFENVIQDGQHLLDSDSSSCVFGFSRFDENSTAPLLCTDQGMTNFTDGGSNTQVSENSQNQTEASQAKSELPSSASTATPDVLENVENVPTPLSPNYEIILKDTDHIFDDCGITPSDSNHIDESFVDCVNGQGGGAVFGTVARDWYDVLTEPLPSDPGILAGHFNSDVMHNDTVKCESLYGSVTSSSDSTQNANPLLFMTSDIMDNSCGIGCEVMGITSELSQPPMEHITSRSDLPSPTCVESTLPCSSLPVQTGQDVLANENEGCDLSENLLDVSVSLDSSRDVMTCKIADIPCDVMVDDSVAVESVHSTCHSLSLSSDADIFVSLDDGETLYDNNSASNTNGTEVLSHIFPSENLTHEEDRSVCKTPTLDFETCFDCQSDERQPLEREVSDELRDGENIRSFSEQIIKHDLTENSLGEDSNCGLAQSSVDRSACLVTTDSNDKSHFSQLPGEEPARCSADKSFIPSRSFNYLSDWKLSAEMFVKLERLILPPPIVAFDEISNYERNQDVKIEQEGTEQKVSSPTPSGGSLTKCETVKLVHDGCHSVSPDPCAEEGQAAESILEDPEKQVQETSLEYQVADDTSLLSVMHGEDDVREASETVTGNLIQSHPEVSDSVNAVEDASVTSTANLPANECLPSSNKDIVGNQVNGDRDSLSTADNLKSFSKSFSSWKSNFKLFAVGDSKHQRNTLTGDVDETVKVKRHRKRLVSSVHLTSQTCLLYSQDPVYQPFVHLVRLPLEFFVRSHSSERKDILSSFSDVGVKVDKTNEVAKDKSSDHRTVGIKEKHLKSSKQEANARKKKRKHSDNDNSSGPLTKDVKVSHPVLDTKATATVESKFAKKSSCEPISWKLDKLKSSLLCKREPDKSDKKRKVETAHLSQHLDPGKMGSNDLKKVAQKSKTSDEESIQNERKDFSLKGSDADGSETKCAKDAEKEASSEHESCGSSEILTAENVANVEPEKQQASSSEKQASSSEKSGSSLKEHRKNSSKRTEEQYKVRDQNSKNAKVRTSMDNILSKADDKSRNSKADTKGRLGFVIPKVKRAEPAAGNDSSSFASKHAKTEQAKPRHEPYTAIGLPRIPKVTPRIPVVTHWESELSVLDKIEKDPGFLNWDVANRKPDRNSSGRSDAAPSQKDGRLVDRSGQSIRSKMPNDGGRDFSSRDERAVHNNSSTVSGKTVKSEPYYTGRGTHGETTPNDGGRDFSSRDERAVHNHSSTVSGKIVKSEPYYTGRGTHGETTAAKTNSYQEPLVTPEETFVQVSIASHDCFAQSPSPLISTPHVDRQPLLPSPCGSNLTPVPHQLETPPPRRPPLLPLPDRAAQAPIPVLLNRRVPMANRRPKSPPSYSYEDVALGRLGTEEPMAESPRNRLLPVNCRPGLLGDCPPEFKNPSSPTLLHRIPTHQSSSHHQLVLDSVGELTQPVPAAGGFSVDNDISQCLQWVTEAHTEYLQHGQLSDEQINRLQMIYDKLRNSESNSTLDMMTPSLNLFSGIENHIQDMTKCGPVSSGNLFQFSVPAAFHDIDMCRNAPVAGQDLMPRSAEPLHRNSLEEPYSPDGELALMDMQSDSSFGSPPSFSPVRIKEHLRENASNPMRIAVQPVSNDPTEHTDLKSNLYHPPNQGHQSDLLFAGDRPLIGNIAVDVSHTVAKVEPVPQISPTSTLAARIMDEMALVEVLVRIQSELASIGDIQMEPDACENPANNPNSPHAAEADKMNQNTSLTVDVIVSSTVVSECLLPVPHSLTSVAAPRRVEIKPRLPSEQQNDTGIMSPSSVKISSTVAETMPAVSSSLLTAVLGCAGLLQSSLGSVPSPSPTVKQQGSVNERLVSAAECTKDAQNRSGTAQNTVPARVVKKSPVTEQRNTPQESKVVVDKKAQEDQIITLSRSALKPHYHSGRITAAEYKIIMRKAIAKIGNSASGEISERRVTKFINAYVEKVIMERV